MYKRQKLPGTSPAAHRVQPSYYLPSLSIDYTRETDTSGSTKKNHRVCMQTQIAFLSLFNFHVNHCSARFPPQRHSGQTSPAHKCLPFSPPRYLSSSSCIIRQIHPCCPLYQVLIEGQFCPGKGSRSETSQMLAIPSA